MVQRDKFKFCKFDLFSIKDINNYAYTPHPDKSKFYNYFTDYDYISFLNPLSFIFVQLLKFKYTSFLGGLLKAMLYSVSLEAWVLDISNLFKSSKFLDLSI